MVVTMKLLVISDTHGNYPLALTVIENAGPVDHIVHLGDELEDAVMLERITDRTLIKVPGNCDPTSHHGRELVIAFAGVRFFITHGDRYRVKSGLTELYAKAGKEHARVVLFGHTHHAAVIRHHDILLVNPGSLSPKSPHASFAIVSIAQEGVSAEVISLPDPVCQQPQPQL